MIEMPIRGQFNYEKICDLLEIPHRYATGMSLEVESAEIDGTKVGAFATMTVTLRRPLTKEEWVKIANLALEGT